MKSTHIKKVDEPVFKDLISVLHRAGIDFKTGDGTYIIEPVKVSFPHDPAVIITVHAADEKEEEYTPKKVKPASYKQIEYMFGTLTDKEAEDLKEEVNRAREEDWI